MLKINNSSTLGAGALIAGALIALTGCVDEESLTDEELLAEDEESLAGDEESLADDLVTNEPTALTQKPHLWAPFPSGKSYMCTQGPSGGVSHNFNNTLYALDFDTPNGGAAEAIVAALAGQVAYVQTGCAVGNVACGGGFGNHVRVNHGGNYYSIYAHLSSVSVVVGNKVGRGQLLGYEGNTGDSTGDHLHFSLHQGNAAAANVAASVSYTVRDQDATLGGAFTDRSASNHDCALPGGHFYASNNVCTTAFNTTGTAKPLTNNTAYLGETCAVGDTDYFSFGGQAGAFTSTVTSTNESISDCSCSILNAQGIELPLGGTEGYVRNDGFNGSEGCACSLATASSATHYLKVYSQTPGAYILNKTLP
jgi:murein DD-endopeptidase MepM/ murein hydrolase activator NlpD